MYAFFVKYGFIFELLLSFFLFTYSLKKRRLYGFRILASVGVLFLYAFLRDFIPNLNAWTESLKYVVLYSLCLCLLVFIFDGSLRSLLFCNAVEAVIKIKEDNLRCIGISIKESKGMVSAHFENYYTGDLDFDEGLPVTTKADKRYHGFGMKSIKMLAEKYGGWVSIRAKEGVFNLNILLPVPSKNQE